MLTVYIVVIFSIFLLFKLHLMSAFITGAAVHAITIKLSRKISNKYNNDVNKWIQAIIAFIVILFFSLISLFCYYLYKNFLHINDIINLIISGIVKFKSVSPEPIAKLIAPTTEEVKNQLNTFVSNYAKHLSEIGFEGLKAIIHAIIGAVIGAMTAVFRSNTIPTNITFKNQLSNQLLSLEDAFVKVMYSQVKISLLNTFLTALFVSVILPIFGIKMPFQMFLIIFTFITGLIPVVGNLISNTIIVLFGLTISINVGSICLLYLIVIHKLEYFLDAKIIGHVVNANAWELLCAMLIFEAAFGLPGIITAPTLYTWGKNELKENNIL